MEIRKKMEAPPSAAPPTPEELEFKRKNLPDKPGCYLYKDEKGLVLYVGKAKSLKKRVNSYWKENFNDDPLYVQKIQRLVSLIRDIDVFVVENETEALLLENELIKKYQPKYNVRAKDDKSFPWVQITNEKFPRIRIIRGPERWGLQHKYIGPFVDAGDLKRLLRFIRKIFPYCTCKRCVEIQKRSRPCIYYQINLCPGPCTGNVTPDRYMENINNIEQMLLGNISPIQDFMQKKMQDASAALAFEEAGIWRDRLKALQIFTINQSVLSYSTEKGPEIAEAREQGSHSEGTTPSTFIDQLSPQQPGWTDLDVIAGHYTKERAGIIIIHVRRGRLVGKTPYIVDIKEKISSKQDYFQILVQQHYLRPDLPLPAEIIPEQPLPKDLQKSLQSALEEKQAVYIRSASEEDKTAGLLRIAKKNIELLIKQKEEYEQYLIEQNITAERQRAMALGLEELKDILDLEDLPMIIEAFDMSNTQGTDPVGSMVTFVEGVPSKSHYRRYKIRSKATPDDVGMMREVMSRRYSKLVEQKDQMPDLIVVDGGKGQLNMADEVLKGLGLQDIPHIGLAKREEEIITVGSEESILLAKDSPALHVLQALRDEAHRFAITYHRLLRKKRQTKSELDDIPNVGEARKNKLLQFFGSVDEVKNASETEIANIVGSVVGKTVVAYFQQKKEEKTMSLDTTKEKILRKKTTKKAALDLIKEEKKNVKKLGK